VRVRDGGLFEVLVDAAAAALVAGFQFDGHAGAVIALGPFDAVLLDVRAAAIAGRNVDAFAPAVEDLRLVELRIDLDLVVVRRFALRDL
jgi:hypothetical protein